MTPREGARTIRFTFDGRELAVSPGTTVAGALLASDVRTWRRSRRSGAARGLFCGIGTCFDCLVDVNDEVAVRACVRPLRDGDVVRTSASLGRVAPAPRPGASSAASASAAADRAAGERAEPAVVDLAVVGAGPAGMAAALAASAAGVRVVLVDSGERLGGQIHRQPLVDAVGGRNVGAHADAAGLTGPAGPGLAARYRALAERGRVQLLLGRTVWALAESDGGFTLHLHGPTGASVLAARALVVATGATELALPFPGWELAGVTTAGAAQVLVKSQNLSVGRRVLVAGSGPFLLPVAASLVRAGAHVVGVVEARRLRDLAPLAGTLARHPGKLVEAVGYAGLLARRGVPLRFGRMVVRCEGDGAVSHAVITRVDEDWRPRSRRVERIAVDAVCCSFGFVPRLELARQLGLEDRRGVAGETAGSAHDATMASSVPGVFVAGELTGIAGSEVAELEGAVAGRAATAYLLGRAQGGAGVPPVQGGGGRAALDRARRFAGGLARRYRVASGWVERLEPATIVCRCEDVTWAEVMTAIAGGARTAREVRGLTRCGMGYCQGRTCGPVVQLAVSAATGAGLGAVGDLHSRSVAFPLPLGDLAGPASLGLGPAGGEAGLVATEPLRARNPPAPS